MKISRESLEIQKLSLVQKRCICFLVQTKSTWKCGPISVEIRMIISRQFHTRKSSCHFSKNHIILHLYLYVCMYVCTAGLDPQQMHTKKNLPANRKGYDNSETTVGKLSVRRIQICGGPGLFSYDPFSSLFQNNFLNNVRTKIVPADSESQCRIL